jgi:hypothetical protein
MIKGDVSQYEIEIPTNTLMNIGHEIGDEVTVKPELFQRAVAEV